VCLQLWHGVPDENCVLDNFLSIYERCGYSPSIYAPAEAAPHSYPDAYKQ
jgi:hypothetical protein